MAGVSGDPSSSVFGTQSRPKSAPSLHALRYLVPCYLAIVPPHLLPPVLSPSPARRPNRHAAASQLAPTSGPPRPILQARPHPLTLFGRGASLQYEYSVPYPHLCSSSCPAPRTDGPPGVACPRQDPGKRIRLQALPDVDLPKTYPPPPPFLTSERGAASRSTRTPWTTLVSGPLLLITYSVRTPVPITAEDCLDLRAVQLRPQQHPARHILRCAHSLIRSTPPPPASWSFSSSSTSPVPIA